MGKHKVKHVSSDGRMKQLQAFISEFSDQHESSTSQQRRQSSQLDGGKALKGGNVSTRKERRKAERQLKKMRKHAFKQGKEIPTAASIDEQKKKSEDEQRLKKKLENQKAKNKAKRKRKKMLKKERVEEEQRALIEANKFEDREIKKYEKLLRLNKRKSKTISQGFKNEGLDFILEAIDKDNLKLLYERGEKLDSTDLPLTVGDSAEEFEDVGESESDPSDLDTDIEGEQDDTDSEQSEEEDSEDTGSFSEDTDAISEMSPPKGILKRKNVSDSSNVNNKSANKNDAKKVDFSEAISEPDNVVSKKKKVKHVVEKSEKKETAPTDAGSNKLKSKVEIKQGKNTDSSKTEYIKIKTLTKKETKEDPNEGSSEDSISESDTDLSGDDNLLDAELNARDSTSLDNSQDYIYGIEDDMSSGGESSEYSAGDDAYSLSDGESSDEDSTTQDSETMASHCLLEDSVQSQDGQSSEEQYTEDIYGRLRDSKGNVVDPKVPAASSTAYIPPAKRVLGGNDEKRKVRIERMKKQLKGLINRVSEGNMQSIANQIEEIFRGNSRADTSEALVEVIMGACISSYLIPERLIMEHCMLLAILHENVGNEVGATFLEAVVQKFKVLLDDTADGKAMQNLVTVLADLYNFRIIHSSLMFDVMKKFSERFNEKDIEILLVILKTVGFSLRKDDPAALKDFIVTIQTKASAVDTAQFEDKSRVEFMLEVILHIKNNNMRKIPNYDPTHLEHLRKLLRNFIRDGKIGASQLHISLADLLDSVHKGKWWLVGSAWTGRQAEQMNTEQSTNIMPGVSQSLLELARKQRMNTDVRRNIFCVIMTAEDFVDAFEKLLKLSLKQQQEREIIHVIVDLCLQEKAFNPFYAYLTQKFCEYDRRFQMTLQFHLWDKFKELSSLGDKRLEHLSRLLAHLIATKALSLSVFKVLEFSEMDKHSVHLMKTTLTQILLSYEEDVVKEAFVRIAALPKLQMLREGLRLFMRHFLLKKRKAGQVDSEKVTWETLKSKVELAEKVLSSHDGNLKM